MKFLIAGVCLLTFISCTPKETEVRTEPINQTKIRAKALNHNYEEEFLIKRVVAVEKKEVAKVKKPIVERVEPKVKVVKKEKAKPAPKKTTKPKISITAKVPTPPKTDPKPDISRTQNVSTPPETIKTILFKLSFYTTLPSENGGYSVTAGGENLIGLKNAVASNYYPLGTKIYLDGFGTVRVADRGGSNFNSSTRLDVLIQRKEGESNTAYLQRVNNMGIQTIEGYIVK